MGIRLSIPVAFAIASLGSEVEPARILGGKFEASGVAHVPHSNQVLVVDDESRTAVYSMELRPDGVQKQPVSSISLTADITDPEGITCDGRHFYVVGSQSKKDGFDGDGLVRFVFDARKREISGVERVQGLKAWLAAHVPELRGAERRSGDDVLNIEGLAWDPHGKRLLLGLRAPVVDGSALVVPIVLRPDAPFARENLRLDGAAIRLPLDGDGIRSLEYDALAKAFRVISGASLDRDSSDFRLLEWDGRSGSRPRPLMTFARSDKPEGITRATLDQRQATVIVFDTGRFAVIE